MMDYADEYAAVDRDHWWFAGRRAAIQAALRRYLPSGSRLLDVGCGTGGHNYMAKSNQIVALALLRIC